MAQSMSSRKRKAVETLLDRNADIIHQLAGAEADSGVSLRPAGFAACAGPEQTMSQVLQEPG